MTQKKQTPGDNNGDSDTLKLLQKSQPIGIFDSGIGGLTVASAISHLLPNEQLIYFGDTAHLPYGDKSADSIRRYSTAIARFLEKRKCKVIVIACNTASARAYRVLERMYRARLLVMDVINPVAEHVARHYCGRTVGIIATRGTVMSRVYPRRIKRLNPHVTVVTLATPLLAPMIEEHFFNNNISRAVVSSYLSKKPLRNISALVLGCTHYPLIRKEVDHFYSGKVEIIDSAVCAADYLRQRLNKHGLLNDTGNKPHEFFVSDYTDSFAQSTKLFFGDKVELRWNRLWSTVNGNPNI